MFVKALRRSRLVLENQAHLKQPCGRINRARMARRTTRTKATRDSKQCFAELLSRDPELSALRAEYTPKPAVERRQASEWAYDASIANSLVGAAFARLKGEQLPASRWPPGFAALAIDPEFAP
ncbi:MAG: hypothetical protein NT154_04200, partial [Verrucomicrobia bacterium]|nr:hypothetical protein [Verrucomicrobiota bacterium]